MSEQLLAILVFISASPLWIIPLIMGIGYLNDSLDYERISDDEDAGVDQRHRFLTYALKARKTSELYFSLYGIILFAEIIAFTIVVFYSLPK